MFARTSTWSGSPEALQKWSENAREKVKGFVEGLPVNAGVMFLVDRESGTALTLTLWDSEGAAEATDQFAEQSHCLRPAGSDPDYTLDCEKPIMVPQGALVREEQTSGGTFSRLVPLLLARGRASNR